MRSIKERRDERVKILDNPPAGASPDILWLMEIMVELCKTIDEAADKIAAVVEGP